MKLRLKFGKSFSMLNVLVVFTLSMPNLMLAQVVFKDAALDSNKLRTYINNRGSISSPDPWGVRWPYRTTNVLDYAFEMGLLVGGEVFDINGDTVQIVNDGLKPGSGGEYDPVSGDPWGWLPESGYDNPNQGSVALSDDSLSWPANWSAWPGVNGQGTQSADLESIWSITDSSNKEFEYYPFPGDSSIRGLGLRVVCRGFQWSAPQYEDITIFTYDIKNMSSKPLNKLWVGLYSDPSIGGPNDFADDLANYDSTEQLIYSWDSNGIGDGGISPSVLAFAILESPNNVGLTSVRAVPFGAVNRPRDDERTWELMKPDSFNVLSQSSDVVLFFGSGYFSLQPGEIQKYAFALMVSDIYQNAAEARNAYQGILTGLHDTSNSAISRHFTLHFSYPNPFNPATTISFSLKKQADIQLEIYSITGEIVRTLVNTNSSVGRHQVIWDGMNDDGMKVSSGVYLYRLKSENFFQSRKMVLLR
ncbi:MAG: FlgD immunoglobulin-like domain containing protein [Calditrichia bacterium]